MSSSKTKYNNLSLRAVEKLAPPISLDIAPPSRSADKDDISELMKELRDKEETIQALVEKNSNILRENHVLRDFMRLKATINPAKIEVKPAQKKHLESHLNNIKIPPSITQKLFPLEIHTVYDLVRCTEEQLRGYEVFTDRNIESIKSTLKKLGFELGTDVRKVASLDEYYIYPSAAGVAGSNNQAQSMEEPSVDVLALKNKVMSLESENDELQERLTAMEAEKTAQASELNELKDLNWKYNAIANHYKDLYSEEKRQVSILKSKLKKSTGTTSPAKLQTEADNKIERQLRSRIAELELLLARIKYEGRDIVIKSDLI